MTTDELAHALSIEPSLLRAVLRAECGTDRVPPDGTRPTIRVEAHLVLRRVAAGLGRRVPGPSVGMRIRVLATGEAWGGERGREPAHAYADLPRRPEDAVRHEIEMDGGGGAPIWIAYHGRQEDEYDALDVADAVVGPEAATACTSWGMAQIVGVPALGLGWEEIRATAAVNGGLGLLVPYLRNVKPAALVALQRGDLLGFASAYNGPGRAKGYADEIAAQWARTR